MSIRKKLEQIRKIADLSYEIAETDTVVAEVGSELLARSYVTQLCAAGYDASSQYVEGIWYVQIQSSVTNHPNRD